MRTNVLPQMRNVYECNSNDPKVLIYILNFAEKVLDRLNKQQLIGELLPLIWDFKTYDSEMILKVIGKLFRIKVNFLHIFTKGN